MESKTNYHPKVKKDLSELFLPFFDTENNSMNLLTSTDIEKGVKEIIQRVNFSGPSFCMVAELPKIQFYYFSDSVENIIGYKPNDIIQSDGNLFFQAFDGDYVLMNQITAKAFEYFHKIDFELRKESSINLYYNMINRVTNKHFSVVQQNFPLSFDKNGFLKGYVAVITDISFYSQIKQPKAVILSKTGEILDEITSDVLEENKLSYRELEIVKLFANGLSNDEVAKALNISFHTVRTHRKNMLKKTNFSTLEDLLSYYKHSIG
jgi:DNA-binding CsgD family transcriptional regulator